MKRLLPNRFVRWIGMPVLIGLTTLAMIFFYNRYQTFRESSEAYDTITKHLDETDPGWRWEDILTARRTVPDERNSYSLQKEIMAMYPHEKDTSFQIGPSQFEMVSGLSDPYLPDLRKYRNLPEPLPFEVADWAGEYLGKRERALAIARKMAERPEGRHPIEYLPNLIDTKLQTAQDLRVIALLLSWDARVEGQLGNFDLAFQDLRAIRNLARSIDDDLLLICMLIHQSLDIILAETVRDVLGIGEAKSDELEILQKELLIDTERNIYAISLRFERAAIWQMLRHVASTDYNIDGKKQSGNWDGLAGFYYAQYALGEQAEMLSAYEQLIEIAKGPTHLMQSEANAWEEWVANRIDEVSKRAKLKVALFKIFRPNAGKITAAYLRWLANMRSAVTAIGCERYRLAHGKWPDKLDNLVSEFLSKVPDDPYTGKQLIYKTLPDGIVVYSVGEDLEDDGGDVLSKAEEKDGIPREKRDVIKPSDIGIRLWNPERRGKSSK